MHRGTLRQQRYSRNLCARRRSHSTSHKARARSATAATSTRHERAAERAVSSRGRRRVANSGRRSVARSVGSRNIRDRRASLESADARRPVAASMAQPVAGANSLVEATSTGVYASGESHRADDRVSTAPANDATVSAAASLSTSEMAQAAIAPHVFPMYTRDGPADRSAATARVARDSRPPEPDGGRRWSRAHSEQRRARPVA